MRSVFIVNPVAGGRNISDELARLLAQAAATIENPNYVITRTTHAGHARELAESYAKTGEPIRLFAVGGDGTLNEVFSGAYPYKNAAVGCIPYGSGNDFPRNFGTKDEFLDLADQLQGEELDIDLFRTEFGVGASIAAGGLDAKIAYDIPKFRRVPLCGGETAYKLSILRNILGKLDRKLKITMDNHTVIKDCILTAVCNGGWYGGGFHAAPECSMDDGQLDVIVVRKIGLARIARVLPLYQKGNHFLNGEIAPKLRDVIDFHRCRKVIIEVADGQDKPIIITVDGECHPTTKLTVEMLPLAGRVVLPKKVFDRIKAT
ncbi:MAG: YegS/Rv2252/BmrU family lipid kinase [Ruminiclostridium sp.]|nr:YegS/Rv2252/BmrU family lipid kinase [Ruminiclostridium sp.]